MRKALSTLLGLSFLVFANLYCQELPIFPNKINSTYLAKTNYTIENTVRNYSAGISYLPTNFVSKSDVIELWNSSSRDSIYSVFNSPLYTGGHFSFSSTTQGLSINSNTGDVNISGDPSNEVIPGVYTVNYKYGNIGMEVFMFAPTNVPVTQGFWKTGPSYDSDLTNSFMIDGKEFIYMANNAQGLYIEMPTSSTGDLRVWGGDDIQIPTSSVWSGGVAEFPPLLIKFFNEEVVPQFSNEKPIDARLVHLSTVDFGKIEFDDVFTSTTPSGPGTAIKSSEWKGRIHLENTSGLSTGTNIHNPKITQASFSENGNLFYIANHNDSGGNEVSELFFIPTLQILRMVGDVSKPVNPASSTDVDSDAGNLLNSSAIKIVDANGLLLNVEIGDLVIKNPDNYNGSNTFNYSDFKDYINGFGLSVNKVEGGIWNDNWLNYLDPSNINSKVNGSYSLDENWEFYFTTSQLNSTATDKLKWYTESTVYRAKLDLSDLNSIKLVVQEEYPLNNIKVPISGLGLDQNGCLFFVAGNTQFALVKIFGWGGDCDIPDDLHSPFVIADTISDLEVIICSNNTFDLSTTVPDYLLQKVSFIHPKGEPYNPIPYDSDPVYMPKLKSLFNISYTDVNDVAISNFNNVPAGVYRVWVKQADNGGSDSPNGFFDLKGKCIDTDWYYEVRVDNLNIDFSYNTTNCSDILLTPSVTFGNITFGKFAFIDIDGSRKINIGTAIINENSGEISGAESGAIYKVEYLAKDSDNGNIGCNDFKKTELVEIKVDIINSNPSDIFRYNDASLCGANVEIIKTILGSSCSNVTGLFINGSSVYTELSRFFFPVGISTVDYTITNAAGNNILFNYSVTVTDNEPPVIANIPDDIIVNSTFPNCSSIVSWIEPTITDNCNYTSLYEVKDELGNIINILNGDEFNLGIYTVTYTAVDDSGNTTKAIINIVVQDANPSVIDITTLPSDVYQCDNNVVLSDVIFNQSCTGGTISNDFILDNGANASGVYPIGTTVVIFFITNSEGVITDAKSINVTINPEIEGEIIGLDLVERDQEFDLSFLPVSGSVGTYSWTIESGDATVLNSEYNNSVFKLKSNTEGDIIVKLEISSEYGCISFFEKTITTKCSSTVEIVIPDILERGVLNKISSIVTGGIVANYNWSVSGIASIENNSQNSEELQIIANDTGAITIYLEVEFTNGCIASTSVTLESECTIEVEIDGPSIIDDGFDFNLTSFVSGGEATSYKWSVVSGRATIITDDRDEGINAKLTGEAVFQLEITNSFGCKAIDQINLKSTGDCKIPNVITPNNDGINDTFVIPCIDTYHNNNILILDRWGKTVFETNNYKGEWDGRNTNGDYLNGTYFYKLTSSNKSERSGYIVVVR